MHVCANGDIGNHMSICVKCVYVKKKRKLPATTLLRGTSGSRPQIAVKKNKHQIRAIQGAKKDGEYDDLRANRRALVVLRHAVVQCIYATRHSHSCASCFS